MSDIRQHKTSETNFTCSRTYVPHITYTYKWRVENISELPSDEFIVAPKFCWEPLGEWHVEIKKNSDLIFYFYLHRHAEEPDIKVEYHFTAYDVKGDKITEERSSYKFTKTEKAYDLFPNKEINEDEMLVEVKLKAYLPPITANSDAASSKEDFERQTTYSFQNDLKSLYRCPKHADVTLRVQKQDTLSAHRSILSVRSPVFVKMFEQGWTTEQQEGIVDIEDMDMSTVKELVAFMYSGELMDYDFDTAMDVYYAADKYDVRDLRRHCVLRMVNSLTKLNAGRALILAEQHHDQVLWDKTSKFICLNSSEGEKQK